MKYGALPKSLGIIEVDCKEMMFYQYLPIKMAGSCHLIFEERLLIFNSIILKASDDYVSDFGAEVYKETYIYLTAKHLYQSPSNSFNRMGYHSDGFRTYDINYIWSDKNPTVFNTSNFQLSPSDQLSLIEMEQQALAGNEYRFKENELLRLNEFNIHKVADVKESGMRTFLKISFSADKYDLIGNSHNYGLDYSWKMKPRNAERNIPQTQMDTPVRFK
jgi:hypothetical protein